MGLQKPPEEEKLPASSPTREHDDITQSGDVAHGGGVMNQGGFQNPDVNMEFFSKAVAVDEPKSYGVELSGGPKMSAQNIGGTGSKNDSQVSSPKTTDKRLQTLRRARIRKPSQQRSRTKYTSAPTRVHDDIAQGGVSQSANLTPSPLTSLPPAPLSSPLGNINHPIQFGTYSIWHHRLLDPLITTSSVNNTNVAPPQLPCPPEMHHDSTGETRHSHSANDCNMSNADSMINQGGFQNPDVEFLSNRVSVDEDNSYGLELSGDPKISVLQYAQNIGGTGSKNDFQPIDAPVSSPNNIDKRLQTLGRAGGISNLQSDVYGLGTSTFLANDDAAMRRSSESSLSLSQTEQTDEHDPYSANSGRSSALVGQTSSRYSQLYLGTSTFVGGVSNLQSDAYAGSNPAYGLGTSTFLANDDAAMRRQIESSLSFSQTEQTDMQHPSSANSSRYSQMYLPQGFQGQRSSSGQVTPLPPIDSSYFSQIAAESSNIQPVIRNQIPARFGISQADLLGTRQRGHYQAPNVQHPMSFSSDPWHGSVPTERTRNIPSGADYANVSAGIPQAASNIHGQPPVGTRNIPSGADYANVSAGIIPQAASNIHGQPPAVSRRGLESSLVGRSRGCRCSIPRPPSTPVSLQPSGYLCMICKRDVAFTPDGPLSQPCIPPVLKALPCHHVFHAQCLKNITPMNQSQNPPCISCAIYQGP